jgi:hypothetical protein
MSEESLTDVLDAINATHGLTNEAAHEPRGKLLILPEEFQLYELRKQLNQLRIHKQGEPHLNDRRARAITEAQEIRREIEGYGETPCR